MVNNFMKKILVLGGTGFLGSYFADYAPSQSIIHTTKFSNLNKNYEDKVIYESYIENEKDLEKALNIQEFSTIVNCIALKSIEQCEKNYEYALWLNSILPKLIAKKCFKDNIKFIHISTDAVYGDESKLKSESDRPNPISNYGRTKLLGENNILQESNKSLIFRCNFIGNDSKKMSLFNYFLKGGNEKKEVNGFTDILFNPVFIKDIPRITLRDDLLPSIYNIGGDIILSKYDFGKMVFEEFSFDEILLKRANTENMLDWRTRAKNLTMDNKRIKSLGIGFTKLSRALKEIKKELES
jgi:dTDP-4-dehydrorhamnose reductase